MNHTVAGREPWQCDAATLAEAYATGALSPVEAFTSVQARMRQVQPVLNAITCWDEEGALAAARASEARWRRGMPRSPLDGVPLTVKDNIPVQGLPCRWGSRLYADHVPHHDELAVARLRAGGAVLLGKTNVPEFTLLGYTDNLLAGPTRNPWDPALTPGGSSGGAVAAVASGVGPLALATDGGGSIRRPCSHAGLAGLKPGWDRVPRENGLPELLPGLEVAGPIARSVDDLLRMLDVIAPAPGRTLAKGPRRIAVWRAIAGGPVDEEILAGLDEAILVFRGLGHVVEVRPAPAIVDRFNREAWPALAQSGLLRVLQPFVEREGEEAVAQRLTPAMRAMFEAARGSPLGAAAKAQELVRDLRAEIGAMFEDTDVLLTPSAAALPWAATQTHPARIAGREAGPRDHAAFTAFVNACGLPALALPMGWSRAGLPYGLQLVGPRASEEQLCALGREWERARPWADRWPHLEECQP